MGVKKTGGVTDLSELKYWLWLSSLVWLRPRAKVLLINALGGARETYFAAESELKELDFLSEREVAMLSDKSLESAKKIADACESAGISILTLRDAAYPRRLAGIYDPARSALCPGPPARCGRTRGRCRRGNAQSHALRAQDGHKTRAMSSPAAAAWSSPA